MDFFDLDSSNKKIPFKDKAFSFCTKILTEKSFYIYIITCMIFMPLGELISQCHRQNFVTQPTILEFYGIVGIIMGFAWLIVNKDKTDWNVSTIFYWTLIIFASIALALSKDIMESTMGYYYDEFYTHFLAYFSLMFFGSLIKKYEYRRNILYTFLGLSLIESVICLLQSLGIRIMDSYFDPTVHAAENLTFGLTQHQNFYAGLSVLFVGACIGTFLFCKGTKLCISIGALLAITFYGSLHTSARIAWVGNATIVLFFIISIFIIRKKHKALFSNILKRFLVAVLIMVSVLVVLLSTWGVLQREATQTSNEIENATTNNVIDRLGSGRVYIWLVGLKTVPDNWISGIGLDNYKDAFFMLPGFDKNTMWYQQKGHNEYIHTMVTQGVPALINYLALLIFASVTAIKSILKMDDRKQQILTWIFFGMFTGYAAQAFFNSSVINTVMYFWIIIGMVMPVNSQKILHLNKKNTK